MFAKRLNASNFLITGLFFSGLGIFICLSNVKLFNMLLFLLSAFLIISGLSSCLTLFNKEKSIVRNISFGQSFTTVLLGVFLLLFPNIPRAILPILFGLYIFFNTLIKLVSYLCLRSNSVEGRFGELVSFIFYLLYSLTLVASPLLHLKITIIIIGIYILLLGLSDVRKFISIVLPNESKNKLKRRVHISLPVFLVAFIPQKMLRYFNGKVKIKEEEFNDLKKDRTIKPDLEVFIHVMPSGAGQMGHVDLCFRNEVISYGSYDDESKKLFEGVGEGVLFTTTKDPYINFLLDENKETIFAFGLRLDDRQIKCVEESIAKLKKDLVPWEVKTKDQNAWIYKLIKQTKPNLYKFKKGKFKAYFVLSTNCVLLADTIIGSAGTDILKINGVITPGTYYDYLNSEYLRDDSMVISFNVYKREEI